MKRIVFAAMLALSATVATAQTCVFPAGQVRRANASFWAEGQSFNKAVSALKSCITRAMRREEGQGFTLSPLQASILDDQAWAAVKDKAKNAEEALFALSIPPKGEGAQQTTRLYVRLNGGNVWGLLVDAQDF